MSKAYHGIFYIRVRYDKLWDKSVVQYIGCITPCIPDVSEISFTSGSELL